MKDYFVFCRVNRQRAHSTSERMTPYCIKDMAALFEKPEELSKKS